MIRLRRSLLYGVITLVATLGVSSQALAAQEASNARAGDQQSQGIAATWRPWDGNQITSAANCKYWKGVISTTYEIPLKNLRCDRIDIGVPPCPVYRWILMVNVDGIAAPEVRITSPAEPKALVLC